MGHAGRRGRRLRFPLRSSVGGGSRHARVLGRAGRSGGGAAAAPAHPRRRCAALRPLPGTPPRPPAARWSWGWCPRTAARAAGGARQGRWGGGSTSGSARLKFARLGTASPCPVHLAWPAAQQRPPCTCEAGRRSAALASPPTHLRHQLLRLPQRAHGRVYRQEHRLAACSGEPHIRWHIIASGAAAGPVPPREPPAGRRGAGGGAHPKLGGLPRPLGALVTLTTDGMAA